MQFCVNAKLEVIINWICFEKYDFLSDSDWSQYYILSLNIIIEMTYKCNFYFKVIILFE